MNAQTAARHRLPADGMVAFTCAGEDREAVVEELMCRAGTFKVSEVREVENLGAAWAVIPGRNPWREAPEGPDHFFVLVSPGLLTPGQLDTLRRGPV